MAPQKNFKKTAAEMFISTASEPHEEVKAQEADKEQKGFNIPKGYILAPEHKSQRLQLLIKPSTKDAIKAIAEAQSLSVNELINKVLEEYVERNGK